MHPHGAIDESAAIDRLLRCLPVPGISCEEALIAERVLQELESYGYPRELLYVDRAHERTRKQGQVGNHFLNLAASNETGALASLPRRMLSSHLDTVPICLRSDPVLLGDEIKSQAPGTGTGADNRTGVAVLLTVAAELKRQQIPHPPLTLTWFVQEEIGLEGSRHLDPEDLKGIAWACNFDGSSPHKMTIGATGGERMDLTIHGRASHAGVNPRDGVSAIVIAAKAIAALHADGWLGRIEKPEGKGTANVGVIQGGDATNVVTPEVLVRAEARSHDRDFRTRIADEIVRAFELAAQSVQNAAGACGSVSVARRVDYDPFLLSEDAPAVRACAKALSAIGRDPVTNISDGGLDANWISRHGVPTVTLGCGQRDPHTTTERVNIADYLDACRAAFMIATGATELDASEGASEP